jgi:hypothetical protein
MLEAIVAQLVADGVIDAPLFSPEKGSSCHDLVSATRNDGVTIWLTMVGGEGGLIGVVINRIRVATLLTVDPTMYDKLKTAIMTQTN